MGVFVALVSRRWNAEATDAEYMLGRASFPCTGLRVPVGTGESFSNRVGLLSENILVIEGMTRNT